MFNLKKWEIEDRKKRVAQYLLDNPKLSIRKIADEFMIGKSTVHRDLHDMRFIDDDVYMQCKRLLKKRRRR